MPVLLVEIRAVDKSPPHVSVLGRFSCLCPWPKTQALSLSPLFSSGFLLVVLFYVFFLVSTSELFSGVYYCPSSGHGLTISCIFHLPVNSTSFKMCWLMVSTPAVFLRFISFKFVILSGQHILNIFLRLLCWKVPSSFSSPFVIFHVSQPYNRIDTTLDLNSFILVFLFIMMLFQICSFLL